MRKGWVLVTLALWGCDDAGDPGDGAVGDVGARDATTPDTATSDVVAVDGVSVDVPSPDAPSADVSSTDAPVADTLGIDAPVADASFADAPVADAPVVDASTADVAVADTPAGDAATRCVSDAECPGVRCDRARLQCAQCLSADDCSGATPSCAGGRCVAAVTCTSPRTCVGRTCDTAAMQCVDCVSDTDCETGFYCRAASCAPLRTCRAARDCNDRGQVCDTTLSRCVDCVADGDCDAGQYCAGGGLCRRRVCVPGARTCLDATTAQVCDPRGATLTTTPCATGLRCASGECRAAASCTPGAASCASATQRQVCNTDGVTYTVTVCAAPAHGSAGACSAGACTFSCDAGYMPSGGACVAASASGLRLISPQSAGSARPRAVFRWSLPAGVDGGRVEVCRDRACTTVVQTADVTGSTWTVTTDLRVGRYFWRVFPRSGAAVGATPTAAWSFFVTARGGNRYTDFDGDGYADLLTCAYNGSSGSRVQVFRGSASGLAGVGTGDTLWDEMWPGLAWAGDVNGDGVPDAMAGAHTGVGYAMVLLQGTGSAFTNEVLMDSGFFGGYPPMVGATPIDLNGDGYGDLVVTVRYSGTVTAPTPELLVLPGSATGITRTVATSLVGTGPGDLVLPVNVGDVNGDGYEDLGVAALGRAMIFPGGPRWISPTMPWTLTGSTTEFGASLTSAGDVDHDGFADVTVGSRAMGSIFPRLNHYRGGAAGVATVPSFSDDVAGNVFASSLARAGDLDGDGYGDVLVQGTSGRFHVYYGGPDGFSASRTSSLLVPRAVVAPGDVNGDGYDDLIENDATMQQVTVLFGAASGVSSAGSQVFRPAGYSMIGRSIAGMP